MSQYRPPPGNQSNAILPHNYNPPSSNYRVVLLPSIGTAQAVTIAIASFGDEIVGLHSIGIKNRNIQPNGFYSDQFGNPSVDNKNQILSDITLQEITGFGEPIVDYKTHYLTPNGLYATEFGEQFVSYFLRYILQIGNDTQALGRAWISYNPRFISPIGLDGNNLATHHQVGFSQVIIPQGLDGTLWGTRILPNSQTLYPDGFSELMGEASIDVYTHYIIPKSFYGYQDTSTVTNDGFGFTTLYNAVQYIIQQYDNEGGLIPQPFGEWVSIENRNKVVGEVGWYATKFGYTQIDNNARIIEPAPILASTPPKQHISHWRQTITVEGVEQPYMAGWAVVYNNADLVSPKGSNTQQFGTPSLVNTKRYFKVGNIETASYGCPMVDYAIRHVELENRHSIASPSIPLPIVDNYTRYVEHQGFDSNGKWQAQVGNPDVSIHFNIIAPRWIDKQYQWWGEAMVRNITPEIHINGHNNEAFGDVSIRTQWRDIATFGDNCERFGAIQIADTKRTISLENNAINDFATGIATITRLGSPPYSLQYIDVNQGINETNRQVANPTLIQNVVYVSGFSTLKFGDPIITGNNIKIESGIYELGVGKPTIKQKLQYLKVTGINETINESRMGKPRLTPHTIYAPYGDMATGQARDNHPAGVTTYVNSGEIFGEVTVTNQNRAIIAEGFEKILLGMPSVALSKQYIAPTGWKGGYFGWHIIPFVPQYIEMYDDEQAGGLFGQASVHYPESHASQTIQVYGLSEAFGNVRVENLNRDIKAIGIEMAQMGQSKSDDTPFFWQGLRVGERVPMRVGGDDISMVSEKAFISLRIRNIQAQGEDMFSMTSNVSDFKKRMTVSRTQKAVLKIYPSMQGFNTQEFGISSLKHGQYFIHPDGNSETYRQGIPS